MKLVSSKLCLAVASTALLFAGCTKKPDRPTPPATAMGMSVGPGPIAGPIDVNLPPEGFTKRPDDFDLDGLNRTALAANTVYFDFDASAIKADQRDKLKAAKEYLEKNPGQRLLLEGHCDWRGTAEYNLGLGDRRANAVKKYLLSLGVRADKLESNSKGSLEAAKDANDAAMAKDRRVDLVIIKAK